MGCGASSNPQVSPRSTPVVPDVGGKSRAFDPSSSDKENVAPRGEESHEEFMARYAQKAAARKEGKPLCLVHEADPHRGGKPWDQFVEECPEQLSASALFGKLPAEYIDDAGQPSVARWKRDG